MFDPIIDFFFETIYGLMSGLLMLVGFVQSFFDIFAGTKKILYQGEGNYLINLFFGHDSVTNAFWAMALIAIVMAFGFAIVAVARKVTDVTGTTKHTIGQILSNFFKCLLIIIMLNAVTVAAINVTNVLLDRINYALSNAPVLNQDEGGRSFTDEEYATMARIYATIGNYSINPSPENRYNVNTCFNEIRGDLYSLYMSGFFDISYLPNEDGSHNWQSGLDMLATAADLTEDLTLNEYNENITEALTILSDELANNRNFRPSSEVEYINTGDISTDVMIFLVSGMGAEKSKQYRDGSIDDALRVKYITGEKDYIDIDVVKKDFNLRKISYVMGFASGVVFLKIMITCVFTFIIRMFNLMLLYISAPLFVSSMSLDEGSRFQTWLSSFVIQLFSGFGTVVVMRLYLIIVPIFVSSDIVFLPNNGVLPNYIARLVLIIGGAWAVMQSSSVITGILAGNPGMAAMGAEAAVAGKVSGAVGMAGKMLGGGAMKVAGTALKSPGALLKAPAKLGQMKNAPGNYLQSIKDAWGPNKRTQAKNSEKAQQAKQARQEEKDQRQNDMLQAIQKLAGIDGSGGGSGGSGGGSGGSGGGSGGGSDGSGGNPDFIQNMKNPPNLKK